MSQVRAYATLYDALGGIDTTGSMTMQILAATNGQYSNAPTVIHAGTDGQLIDPTDKLPGVNIAASATYRIHRGDGPVSVSTPWTIITTASGGTMTLSVALGQDPYP